MPISLVLAELAKRRLMWTPIWADWSRVLELQELVLRRARGAFLHQWFGTGLQMAGPALLVAILNLDALRSQFLYASSQAHDSLNLMEPVMGMAGSLVGSILGMLAGAFLPWFPAGVMIFLGVLGGLIAVGGGIASLALASNPIAQAAFRVSAALARLVEQFLNFWNWLTGPRSNIVNPIIRTALDILDRIPAVTAQLAAFVAIFFVRIVPWFSRLVDVIPAYYRLITSVVDFVKLIWQGMLERLTALVAGPESAYSVALRTMALLQAIPDLLYTPGSKTQKEQGFAKVIGTITRVVAGISIIVENTARQWIDELREQIQARLHDAPVLRLFEEAGDIFHNVIAILAAHFPRIAAPVRSFLAGPGFFSRLMAEVPSPLPEQALVRSFTESIAGPEPTSGMWDEWFRLRSQGLMPDLDAFLNRGQLVVNQSGELPSIFSIGSDLARDLRQALDRRPPDVFAGERSRLRTEAGGEPRRRLLDLRREEVWQYRNLIGSLIDRMLPASAAGSFAQLESILIGLDRTLNRELPPREPSPAAGPRIAPLPVLDVRAENRLRLEAPRFRMHYRGPVHKETRATVQAFGRQVRAAWIGQGYLLTPVG